MNQDELEDIERSLTTALLGWAIASTAVGSAIAVRGMRSGHPQVTRFGRQSALWGAVDGLIAGAGMRSRMRRGTLSSREVKSKARTLRLLLLANAAADVGYVAGGGVIAGRGLSGRTTFRMSTGDGLAIIIQGAFLFALDSVNARKLMSGD